MNRISALRRMLSLAAVVTLSASVPPGAALGGSTSRLSGPAAPGVANVVSPIAPAALACSPGAAACAIRMTFAVGAYSGQAHATLTGVNAGTWFVVRARAEQTMIVLVEGAGPTRGVVTFPDGRSSGQPGGRIFDGIVPTSGDYRIHVTESTMGSAWSGGVDVLVVIY